jgi:UDP-N-acetylbacillosamine N-acetyltransferase
MKRGIILGAGGHSRSLVALLQKCCPNVTLEVWDIGETNAVENNENEMILGCVVKSMGVKWETALDKNAVYFLALGNNSLRSKCFDILIENGCEVPSIISTDSCVHKSAEVDHGVIIFDKVYLGPLVKVSSNCLVNTGAIIEHETFIGSHCQISPGAIVCGRVKIGNSVFIGAGATIIDNINIADNITIGMGGVVVHSLEKAGTYIGVPVRNNE